MPTEVYPSAHQLSTSLPFHPGWLSPIPPTGPARTLDLLVPPCAPRRMPGSVLPNGLRNPWAPYAGETYRPSAEGAAVIQSNSFAGSGSIVGGGRSMIAPRAMSLLSGAGGGGGGASVIAPSSVGLGGYREDDGWNGSMGRAHAGHAPDLSSTAGALGYLRAPTVYGGSLGGSVIGGGGEWLNAPASWGNHARMTPGLPAMAMSVPADAVPRSYCQPMIPASSHSGERSRRGSVPLPIARGDICDCPVCRPADTIPRPTHGHAHAHAHTHVHAHKRNVSANTPFITVESPYRHVREIPGPRSVSDAGSGGVTLERRRSSRSRHSRCSECSPR